MNAKLDAEQSSSKRRGGCERWGNPLHLGQLGALSELWTGHVGGLELLIAMKSWQDGSAAENRPALVLIHLRHFKGIDKNRHKSSFRGAKWSFPLKSLMKP